MKIADIENFLQRLICPLSLDIPDDPIQISNHLLIDSRKQIYDKIFLEQYIKASNSTDIYCPHTKVTIHSNKYTIQYNSARQLIYYFMLSAYYSTSASNYPEISNQISTWLNKNHIDPTEEIHQENLIILQKFLETAKFLTLHNELKNLYLSDSVKIKQQEFIKAKEQYQISQMRFRQVPHSSAAFSAVKQARDEADKIFREKQFALRKNNTKIFKLEKQIFNLKPELGLTAYQMHFLVELDINNKTKLTIPPNIENFIKEILINYKPIYEQYYILKQELAKLTECDILKNISPEIIKQHTDWIAYLDDNIVKLKNNYFTQKEQLINLNINYNIFAEIPEYREIQQLGYKIDQLENILNNQKTLAKTFDKILIQVRHHRKILRFFAVQIESYEDALNIHTKHTYELYFNFKNLSKQLEEQFIGSEANEYLLSLDQTFDKIHRIFDILKIEKKFFYNGILNKAIALWYNDKKILNIENLNKQEIKEVINMHAKQDINTCKKLLQLKYKYRQIRQLAEENIKKIALFKDKIIRSREENFYKHYQETINPYLAEYERVYKDISQQVNNIQQFTHDLQEQPRGSISFNARNDIFKLAQNCFNHGCHDFSNWNNIANYFEKWFIEQADYYQITTFKRFEIKQKFKQNLLVEQIRRMQGSLINVFSYFVSLYLRLHNIECIEALYQQVIYQHHVLDDLFLGLHNLFNQQSSPLLIENIQDHLEEVQTQKIILERNIYQLGFFWLNISAEYQNDLINIMKEISIPELEITNIMLHNINNTINMFEDKLHSINQTEIAEVIAASNGNEILQEYNNHLNFSNRPREFIRHISDVGRLYEVPENNDEEKKEPDFNF